MYRKLGIFLVVLALFGCFISNASTEEWILYGPRALGMGGAGVAVGDKPTAYYWNPASLADANDIGLKLIGGLQIGAEGNVLKEFDEVAKKVDLYGSTWDSLSTKISSGTPLSSNSEIGPVLDVFLNDIIALDKKGQGFIIGAAGGASILYKQFGINGSLFAYGAADPALDITNLALSNDVTNSGASTLTNVLPTPSTHAVGTGANEISQDGQDLATSIVATFGASLGITQAQAEELVYQAEEQGVDTSNPQVKTLMTNMAESTASGGQNTTQNNSGFYLSGIEMTEIGVGYGRSFMDGKLAFGLNLKGINGTTYYSFVKFDSGEQSDDLISDVTDKNNTKTTTQFSVDAGVLFSPIDNLRIGLTGRNLTSPTFDFVGNGNYKVDPQARIGFAYNVSDAWVIALDYDITKNSSIGLNGYESQVVSAGTEFNLISFLKFRGGIYENTASENPAPVYTAGLGIHIIALDVDLAGSMSTEEVEVEVDDTGGTTKIAERYSFMFSAGLVF